LRYPVLSDSADVPRDIQNLATDVDGKMAIDSQGVLASRPTTGLVSGQYYFATDNNLLYRYNGSAWITLNAAAAVDGAPGVGTLRTLGTGANQAAAGNDSRFNPGTVDGAANVGTLRTLGTGALQAMAGNDSRVDQPGDLLFSAGVNAPSGYLACDGASYLRASFAALFAELGGASSTWGLPDGTHFNVPDFRGRSPMGDGNGTGTNRVFGTYVGEDLHTLSVGEMPVHNHGGVTGNDSPDHTHQANGALTSGHGSTVVGAGATVAFYDDVGSGLTTTGASVRHTHSVSNQGGGTGHNTVHPCAVVHVFIKT
jgi:microcystin-dependent protein